MVPPESLRRRPISIGCVPPSVATTAEEADADGLTAHGLQPDRLVSRRVPASTPEVRRAYLDQSVLGYVIYAVGAVTAFIAVALSLSDAQAGLHSSALAVGMVLAGGSGDRLDHIVGPKAMHLIALALLAAGSILVVWAPVLLVTLGGAGSIGLGGGLVQGHASHTLSAGGGALARVRLGRAALMSMVTSLVVPLVIGGGVALGLGWQVVALPALLLVGLAVVASRRRLDRGVGLEPPRAVLSRAYWLAWALVVLVVSIEFAMVFWGSSLVERQAGISLGHATIVLSAFFVGMVTGRAALSSHTLAGRDPVSLMRAGIGLAGLGSLVPLVWPSVAGGTLGLLLGGTGVSLLYPLGASISLAAVPGQARQAASRLVLASGLAILVAPFVLGVMADAAGVIVGWLLIPVVCVAALALTIPVGRTVAAHGASKTL